MKIGQTYEIPVNHKGKLIDIIGYETFTAAIFDIEGNHDFIKSDNGLVPFNTDYAETFQPINDEKDGI